MHAPPPCDTRPYVTRLHRVDPCLHHDIGAFACVPCVNKHDGPVEWCIPMLHRWIGKSRTGWTVGRAVSVTIMWSSLAVEIAALILMCRSRLRSARATADWARTRRQLEREVLTQERLAAWMGTSWSSPSRYAVTQRKKPALARQTLADVQGKYVTWKRAIAQGDADGQAAATAPRSLRLTA